MKTKHLKIMKIAGICGVLVPLIAFIFIGFSIYYATEFSWTENWLSELAGNAGEKPIWAARGLSSIIFNIGIIVVSISGLFYAIILKKLQIFISGLGRFGTSLLIIDMLALCAIGILPLTTGYLHEIASFTFFILIPLSSVPIGITLIKNKEKKFGVLIIILGIISFCAFPMFFIQQPIGGNAIIEIIPIICLSICSIIFGYFLLKNRFELIKK